MTKLGRKILKISAWGFLTLSVLVGAFAWSVQKPGVQSWLVMRVKGLLERTIGTEVEVEEVRFSLPVYAVIRGISVKDESGIEAIRLNEFRMDLLSFSLWDYITNKEAIHDLTINKVVIKDPEIFIYKSQVDSIVNIGFIISNLKGDSTKKSNPPLSIDISNISVTNGRIRYIDSTSHYRDSVFADRLNYRNMDFGDVSADLSFSLNSSGGLLAEIRKLSMCEKKSLFSLGHLQGVLMADSLPEPHPYGSGTPGQFVALEEMDMYLENTHITGRLFFPNESISDLLNNRLDDYIMAEFHNSRIDFGVFRHFLPKPLPLQGLITLQGGINGTLDSLSSEDLQIRYMDETLVNSAFVLRDMLTPEKMNIRANWWGSYLTGEEIQELIPAISLPEALLELNLLQIEGSFNGHYSDFQLVNKAKGKEGEWSANLHLRLPNERYPLRYEGELKTLGLNTNLLGLGAVLPSNHLNLQGNIKGSGTSLATVKSTFNGSIIRSDFFGYYIDSSFAELQIANKKVNANLWASDTEGSGQISGEFDFSQSPRQYNFTGQLANFNLNKYNLYERPIKLSTELSAHISGDSLNQLTGDFFARKVRFEKLKDEEELFIPDIFLRASDNGEGQKYFNLKSDIGHADLSGNFNLTQASRLIQNLVKEFRLFFANDDSMTQAWYAQKVLDSTEVMGQVAIAPGDSLNRLLDYFEIPAHIGESSSLLGNFTFGLAEQLTINLTLEDSKWGDISLGDGAMDVDFFKLANNGTVAIGGGFGGSDIYVGEKFYLDQIRLDVDGLENQFESTLIAVQEKNGARLQTQLKTAFFANGIIRSEVNDNNSFLLIKQDTLFFQEENSITFQDGGWDVANLLLENSLNTYLRFDGRVARDSVSVLNANIGRLDLELIRKLYPFPYSPEGYINLDIQAKDLLNAPGIYARARIDSFSLEEYTYGNVYLDARWQNDNSNLYLKANLVEQRDTSISLSGTYTFGDTISPIDFELATITPVPLNHIFPFVKTQLYGIKGLAELNEFTIKGKPDDLNVNGIGQFTDAQFGISYFKTEYSFNGSIQFDNNSITFPRIKLFDKYGHYANFHGYIYHKGLRKFTFDLQLEEMQNFLIMDTQKGDNELFYGKVYIKDGIADITGDLDKLVVQAIGASGANSFLKIPITYGSDYGKPEFIKFKGDDDLLSKPIETGLKGFELNLTAITTEDLQIDLIFDERVGDIMRGRGDGNLTMKINEEGEFTMNGKYEIRQGNYLFTAQNVLNKKFEVKEGGQIIWSGDPYNAQIDMDAFYPLYADVRDLLNEDRAVRAPVNVLMNMTGSLLEPNIQLSIELPNVNQSDVSEIVGYLKTIKYDEQELNKQVFSLMVFNRFAPAGGFLTEDAAGLGVTTSISELLSNQLNYWLSRAVSDKVNVSVGTSNFQDVNLLVSAKLFNDRVILERDGTLLSPNSNFSIGNISIIIKLLPRPGSSQQTNKQESELVLEVFNRENLDTELHSNTNQTGIGIFFKKDFDQLSDLFKKANKKK